MKVLAPIAEAAFIGSSSAKALKRTAGKDENDTEALRQRKNSNPPARRMSKSSTTTAGNGCNDRSE